MLAEHDQNIENAGNISDESSTDEEEDEQSLGDPIQFAFPKLIDDDEDNLRRAYINNVDVMIKKQRHSPDFKPMWDYLKDGTMPAKTRARQTVLADHPNYLFGNDGLLYHLFSPAQRKKENILTEHNCACLKNTAVM